jgi:hypothetical protein
LSSRAKLRDLQFSSSASVANESETADPSASLGMTKRREQGQEKAGDKKREWMKKESG